MMMFYICLYLLFGNRINSSINSVTVLLVLLFVMLRVLVAVSIFVLIRLVVLAGLCTEQQYGDVQSNV